MTLSYKVWFKRSISLTFWISNFSCYFYCSPIPLISQLTASVRFMQFAITALSYFDVWLYNLTVLGCWNLLLYRILVIPSSSQFTNFPLYSCSFSFCPHTAILAIASPTTLGDNNLSSFFNCANLSWFFPIASPSTVSTHHKQTEGVGKWVGVTFRANVVLHFSVYDAGTDSETGDGGFFECKGLS